MNLNDFNSSKYLGQGDVPQPILVTIAGWGIADMRDGTKKPYMTFVQPNVKPMLINATNRMALQDMFGTDDTDAMVGKQVVVFNDKAVSYGGKITGGLRVRAPKQAPAVPGTPGHRSRAEILAAEAAQAAQDSISDEIPF